MAYGHDETIRHGLDDSGGNGDELTNYREDEARELLKKQEAEDDRMTGDDWSHLAEMRARAEGLAEPQRTRFEELTRKCYVLIHAACVASEEHRHRWAWLWTQKANELFDLRDNLTIEKAAAPDELPLGIVPHSPRLTLFQAIFWTLFGPDSHSLVRYFDHGCVPQWAKESKWTRRG